MIENQETENKERVVLYVFYDDDNLDCSYEQERMLRKFCKDKNYNIVGVFRTSIYSDLDGISPVLKNLLMDAGKNKYDKLVCFSLKELSLELQTQAFVTYIMELCGITFETVLDGYINQDFSFLYSFSNNDSNRKELEYKNNQYIVNISNDLNAYEVEKMRKEEKI